MASLFLSYSATAFKNPETVDVHRLIAVDIAELDAITALGMDQFLTGELKC